MHNLGQARRALYVVSGEARRPQTPADLIGAHGKTAGQLRSVVEHVRLDRRAEDRSVEESIALDSDKPCKWIVPCADVKSGRSDSQLIVWINQMQSGSQFQTYWYIWELLQCRPN